MACSLLIFLFLSPPLPSETQRNKAAGLEIQSLSLVTFNVLFNKVLGDLRHPALLELVHTYHPDVIAFQEADQAFLNILLNTPWVLSSDLLPVLSPSNSSRYSLNNNQVKEYYLSDTIGTTIRPYGCLLLSKIPWSHLFLHDLPTKLGRKYSTLLSPHNIFSLLFFGIK